MKTFDDQTYYEILKIPVDAQFQDIKRAYREALDLYEEDSLATYALFSDEERAELLDAIALAYDTLSNPERRSNYDRHLMGSTHPVIGAPPPADRVDEPQERDTAVPARPKDLNAWVRRRYKEEEARRQADEMISKDLISGTDLKRMRETLGIELVEIFNMTRISISTLTMIEENQFETLPAEVFLKSFLKSYAEILQVDSHRVVEGYFRYMSLADRS